MLEAVRNFYVFYSLYYIGKNKKPVLKILYSDPIIETKNKINIGTYNVEYKVFFSLPFEKRLNLGGSFFKTFGKNITKDIYSIINNNLPLLFSAIKNGIYLIIYYLENCETKKIIEHLKNIIVIYQQKIKSYLRKEFINPSDVSKILKLFLSLAIYHGLLEKIKDFKLIEDKGISLEEFEVKLKSLLESLGLPQNEMFNKEISRIKENTLNLKDGEYKLYDIYKSYYEDYTKKENQKDITGQKIEMRNFFAHGGLENTITKIIKKDGKIYLKYDETVKNGNENRSKLEFIISELTKYL
jgi:CRISPR-associated protein Csx1